MEKARKLVVFPTSQFFAVTGLVRLHQGLDPYTLSITDILNDWSHATHLSADHLHKPGKIVLDEAEFYSLADNRQRCCPNQRTIHIPLTAIQAAIDFHPERHLGNPHKRIEHRERSPQPKTLRFILRQHTLSGTVDAQDVYRRSEQVVGMTDLTVEDAPAEPALSLPDFLDHIGCPRPGFMAVHLGNVFHS